MSDPARARPGGVTLVVVLTYVSGILSLLAGLLVVVLAYNPEVRAESGVASAILLTAGIISILLGIITLLVAGGLRHGRNSARVVVSIVMVLQIISAVVTASGSQAQLTPALVQVAVSGLILALLWTGAASDFFRGRRLA